MIGCAQILRSACGIAAVPLSSCASLNDVPPMLRHVAECVSETLSTIPGIEDVRMEATNNRELGTHPTIQYRFTDRVARRHTVRFIMYLTKDSNGRDLYAFDVTGAVGGYIFGPGMPGQSPVFSNLMVLETQCGATGIIIT